MTDARARRKADNLIRFIKGSVKQKDLARLLDESPQVISYKMAHGTFTPDELICIFHYIGMSSKEIGEMLSI